MTTSPLDAASSLEAGSEAATETTGAPHAGQPDVLFDVEGESTSALEAVLGTLDAVDSGEFDTAIEGLLKLDRLN